MYTGKYMTRYVTSSVKKYDRSSFATFLRNARRDLEMKRGERWKFGFRRREITYNLPSATSDVERQYNDSLSCPVLPVGRSFSTVDGYTDKSDTLHWLICFTYHTVSCQMLQQFSTPRHVIKKISERFNLAKIWAKWPYKYFLYVYDFVICEKSKVLDGNA